jgi:hypothetical protein
MRHVREAVAFLEGDDDSLFARMHLQLEQSARSLDYEKARKVRNSIRLLQSLVGAHARLKEARENNTLLIVQPGVAPGSRNLLLLVQGMLWANLQVSPGATEPDIVDRLDRAWQRYLAVGLPPLDHNSLDDVVILSRWIAKMEGAPSLLRIDLDAPDWAAIARRAIQLRDAELLQGPSTGEDIELDSAPAEPDLVRSDLDLAVDQLVSIVPESHDFA